jgi:hypothetical protein
MNIRTPKTERKRSSNGRGRKYFRNIVVILVVLVLLTGKILLELFGVL